jgi:hypothetical protein
MIYPFTTSQTKGTTMSRFRTTLGIAFSVAAILAPLAVNSATADVFGGIEDTTISLQSPQLDATNTWDAEANQRMANGWVAQWGFGSGLIFQSSWAPVGATINLTYNVKTKDGNPAPFTIVNLRVNKAYSKSYSAVEVDGNKAKGVYRGDFDQANVSRRTDAFGNVTYALKHVDLESSSKEEPTSYTTKPVIAEDGLDDFHSQVMPEVRSEKKDHSVISEFHFYLSKTQVVVPATTPSITLVTPKLDQSNSVIDAARNIKQAYAPIGGDLVVVYKVVGNDGKTAVPNKVVTLSINGGKSTLTAKSDAFGFAAFTLKNSDTKPNASPSSLTSAMPATSSAFATLTPSIEGTTPTVAEGVEFHYYRGITTSVSKSGKKFSLAVAIAGASGKSASVAVTGAKSSTVKVTSALQVVNVPVSAGAKTVTVKVDGKSYTSKVTVK